MVRCYRPIPAPRVRKRWPAIEPHWRVLHRDGRLTIDMTEREARWWAGGAIDLCNGERAAAAIVKVTPK